MERGRTGVLEECSKKKREKRRDEVGKGIGTSGGGWSKGEGMGWGGMWRVEASERPMRRRQPDGRRLRARGLPRSVRWTYVTYMEDEPGPPNI